MNRLETILIALITGLSLTLLLALKFPSDYPTVHLIEMRTICEVASASSVALKTNECEWAHYKVGDSDLWLAPKTTLELKGGSSDRPVLTMIEGRTVTDGGITLGARLAQVNLNGRATVVLYPWIPKIDGMIFMGQGEIASTIDDATIELDENQAFSIDLSKTNLTEGTTFPPFSITGPELQPFYDWALSTDSPPVN